MKEIIMDFNDDGTVKLETKGFAGKTCKTESQFIKDVLGKVVSEQLAPVYYTVEHKVYQNVRGQKCG